MSRNARYVAQYFCSLDDPEATRTWFVIDRRTGMPLFENFKLRLFDRREVDAFLAEADLVAVQSLSAGGGGPVDEASVGCIEPQANCTAR